MKLAQGASKVQHLGKILQQTLGSCCKGRCGVWHSEQTLMGCVTSEGRHHVWLCCWYQLSYPGDTSVPRHFIKVWGGALYYSALHHCAFCFCCCTWWVLLLWPGGRVWTCLCRTLRNRGIVKCRLDSWETSSLLSFNPVTPHQAVPIKSYNTTFTSVCCCSPKSVVDPVFYKEKNMADHEQRD